MSATIFIQVKTSWFIKCSTWNIQYYLWSTTHYHIHVIHVTIIHLRMIHIWNIPFPYEIYLQLFRIYVILMLKKMANLMFFSFFFHPIFSLSGLTLEMMIFNSTYFSSPFHDSSLFTFPAHLNQEYLQTFFSTPYLEDQSVYLKGEEYPQATQPLMSLITQACPSVWPLVSLTHPKSVYHYQSLYHLCILRPEFYQFSVSKKVFHGK